MSDYNAVFSILVIVAIAALFYGPWQEACADYARQIIFEQRQILFDLAADGKIEFESASYQTLRLFLEKTIRFSHEMTIIRFIYIQIAMRDQPIFSNELSVQRAVEQIRNGDTRKALAKIVRESTRALVVAMAARSFILALVMLVLLPARRIGLWTGYRNGLQKAEKAVQKEVELVA